MARHRTFRPNHFDNGLARVGCDYLASVRLEIRRPDKRFRQVNRIVDDYGNSQKVAVPDRVLGDGGAVAAGIPFRRIQPFFRWVVVIVSMSPSNLPVEKPCHVCAA
jgi:hypothetical protein